MVDYRKLLDAFVGAVSRSEPHQDRPEAAGTPTGGQPSMREQLEQNVRQLSGQSPEQLLQKAKDLAAQHPGLTQAALVGLAGLLFKGRKKGKMTGNLVKLGGLAVIGGLAYRAYQSRQGSQEIGGTQGTVPALAGGASSSEVLSPPERSRFHPVSQTEDDALLFLKTMVAAASADGHIDDAERARIVKGMTEAGIDPRFEPLARYGNGFACGCRGACGQRQRSGQGCSGLCGRADRHRSRHIQGARIPQSARRCSRHPP